MSVLFGERASVTEREKQLLSISKYSARDYFLNNSRIK
jgi:hypothetical protein